MGGCRTGVLGSDGVSLEESKSFMESKSLHLAFKYKGARASSGDRATALLGL